MSPRFFSKALKEREVIIKALTKQLYARDPQDPLLQELAKQKSRVEPNLVKNAIKEYKSGKINIIDR